MLLHGALHAELVLESGTPLPIRIDAQHERAAERFGQTASASQLKLESASVPAVWDFDRRRGVAKTGARETAPQIVQQVRSDISLQIAACGLRLSSYGGIGMKSPRNKARFFRVQSEHGKLPRDGRHALKGSFFRARPPAEQKQSR